MKNKTSLKAKQKPQGEAAPATGTRSHFADIFKRVYAAGIRQAIVQPGRTPGDAQLPVLYNNYRHAVQHWTGLAQQDLGDCPDLGEIPVLVDNDYLAALTRLAEYCENAARLLEAPKEAKPREVETSREKPWDDSRPGFILISEATGKYCDGGNAPKNLSRDHCRPSGGFDYMRNGRRCKVDEKQFAAYAEIHRWPKAAVREARAFIDAYEKSPEGQKEARKRGTT